MCVESWVTLRLLTRKATAGKECPEIRRPNMISKLVAARQQEGEVTCINDLIFGPFRQQKWRLFSGFLFAFRFFVSFISVFFFSLSSFIESDL